jgi:hypothetical protein
MMWKTGGGHGSRAAAYALFGLAACGSAGAEDAGGSGPQVWISPGLYSYHSNREKGLRDNNIGFGAEVRLNVNHGLVAGSFINSVRTRTHYAGYAWRPLHWQPAGINFSAGVMVAAFNGYPRYHNGGWFVAPLPVLSVEGRRLGLNVVIVPALDDRVSSAISFQVKLRVW